MIAAQNHAFINVFRAGNTFIQCVEGFVNHRAEDAVHGKGRGFLDDNAFLAQFLSPGQRGFQCFIRCLIGPDDLQ